VPLTLIWIGLAIILGKGFRERTRSTGT
jgi:hypothetical protein